MAKQIPLSLPVEPSVSREDFLVSDANAQAAALIDAWPAWDALVYVLVGPQGAGKSHLVTALARKVDAPLLAARQISMADVARTQPDPLIVVEDADGGVEDETLFHLINAVRNSGRHLILTARSAPARWQVRLPDLASRLNACQIVRMGAPDEMLLTAVLMKQFSDRQISVDTGVIDYLVKRMPRDFASLQQIVVRLDQASLSAKRAVTVPLARSVLADMDRQDAQP